MVIDRKADRRVAHHLSEEEYQVILDASDPTTRPGIRDRAMVQLAVAAGLRVSELVGLRMGAVTFDGLQGDPTEKLEALAAMAPIRFGAAIKLLKGQYRIKSSAVMRFSGTAI